MAGGRGKRGGPLGGAAIGLDVPVRPLTYAEQEQLVRRCKSPQVGVLRVLGVLFSLGAILLSVTWYLGFPYDPGVFPIEVVFVGILGVAFAGGTRAIVRAPRAALRRGEVIDATGTIQPYPARLQGSTAVSIGPLAIVLPVRAAQPITPGLAHRIVLALETRRIVLADLGVTTGALLLAVDDRPLSVPARAHVVQVVPGYPGAVQAAALGVPMPAYPVANLAAAPPPAPAAAATTAHVFCPRCGYENPPDAHFCPRCGNTVPVLGPPTRASA